MKKLTIIMAVILYYAWSGEASLVPKFVINPKNSVEVGEEVMFSALNTTYSDKPILLRKARYEWDFGDGYSFKFGAPQPSSSYSGIAVVHYFMKPGKFTVTLKVTVYPSFASDGTPQGTPTIKSDSSAITVSGVAPLQDFSLLHASFTAHLAQYVYATIPSIYQGNQTTLRIKLIKASGDTTVLLTKSNLSNEERFLFDQKKLTQGEYILVAELLNSDNTNVSGGIWREKISKPYDGIPKVGIDENNAFNINGKPFFPIGSFMTDPGSVVQKNIDSAQINALHTEGYYPNHTISTWSDYLTNAATKNLMCMGPTRGSYSWGEDWPGPRAWQFNHDVDTMAQFVISNKDKPSMLMWSWEDEPNMGGRTTKVYPPVLAAWQYVCHKNDPQHPVGNGLYLADWLKCYGSTYCKLYDFLTVDSLFGGKKWMQDVLGGDIYPIQGRLWSGLNYSDMGPVAANLDAVDRLMNNNRGLAPYLPYIQPCKEQATDTVPAPTGDQINMLAWLNIIHGAKGILWFEFFDQTTMQWAAMKKFAQQVLPLTSIVLGPTSRRTITHVDNVALNRVDFISRDYDSNTTYIFAARVTEPRPLGGSLYKGVEPNKIVDSFSVSGFGDSCHTVALYENNRIIPTNRGKFSDTFALNAVHIYRVSTMLSAIKDDLKKKDAFPSIKDFTISHNNGNWMINYYLPPGVKGELTLFDGKGRVIKMFSCEKNENGLNTVKVSLANLSSGIYFCKFKSNGISLLKKVQIIR